MNNPLSLHQHYAKISLRAKGDVNRANQADCHKACIGGQGRFSLEGRRDRSGQRPGSKGSNVPQVKRFDWHSDDRQQCGWNW
jgi:hypothetical protein